MLVTRKTKSFFYRLSFGFLSTTRNVVINTENNNSMLENLFQDSLFTSRFSNSPVPGRTLDQLPRDTRDIRKTLEFNFKIWGQYWRGAI